MDCGDDQPVRGVQPCEDLGQGRRRERLAEFVDVRTCEKGASRADYDDRTHRFIRQRARNPLVYRVANGVIERIHRRRVDGQDGYFIIYDKRRDRLAHLAYFPSTNVGLERGAAEALPIAGSRRAITVYNVLRLISIDRLVNFGLAVT